MPTGDRQPDIKLEIYFSEIGIQVDYDIGNGPGFFCRDFRGDHNVDYLKQKLWNELLGLFQKFISTH